ncbi:MAG: phosphohistidine phosphatase [Chloroflexi bacterium HGW-Chloroflexi-9]|nr:MAG: phosphohistidine phosphatase [Chloroflexi bacterium HGW-Chloroflexi-9]
MRLLLVRHAIAEERDASRWPDDADRPLSADGEARFRPAAHGLALLNPRPDAILSSGYRRAWRTAEVLAEEAGWPVPDECTAMEPGGDAEDVLATVDHLGGSPDALIVLVGHEPDLGDLATALLGSTEGVPDAWKKGGALLLERAPGEPPGRARLLWYHPPRRLRDAGQLHRATE